MRFVIILFVLGLTLSAPAENLLRNGSFEQPFQVGTTIMLQGQEPNQHHWGNGGGMFTSWQPIGAEGWWCVGLKPGPEHLRWLDDSAQARSGTHTLWLQATDKPVGVVCGAGQLLPPGKATFSLWVKTANATGRVRFDCLPDKPDMSGGFLQETATARVEISLPQDTAGRWLRLTGTLAVPAEGPPQQMAMRVHLEKGTLWLDDAQVEPGPTATLFNLRPAEQLQVRIAQSRALPIFIAGKSDTVQLTVTHTGMALLSGELQVCLARWDGKDEKLVAKKVLQDWAPNAVFKVKAALAGFRPDAYVAFIRLIQGDKTVVDGLANFDGAIPAGGSISRAMVKAPCVARFVLADSRPNRDLFGSGNMMVNTGGSWWGGYPVADYIEARELGFRYSREQTTDDSTYRLAAGGMRSLGDGPKPWSAPEDLPQELRNPVKKECADLSNPAVWPYLERSWRQLAADLNGNPLFPLVHVTGEEMVLYGGALCPTDAADADFRAWVKEKHRTLTALSAAWGRTVKSWDEVEQIISARMVRERLVKVEKEQEKRLDWLGAADKLNTEQAALLKADPGRGMDWLRWRNDLYLNTVSRMAKVFHKVNRDTLLCNHFCWPDFVPQTAYGLARRLDAMGMDTQYPCGLPGSLGTPAETIDMLGMYEAFADDKPFWGMEIYIQPKFPAEMPATQVWGFIAHGMDVVNNFAWKPYSDAGLKAKRWNEPGAPPWWFIIDFDGTHMPQFDPLVRATREVNRFDATVGGHTLKRVKPDAALFVSGDAGILSHFETRGQWWESPVTHARCELGWLLRLNGVSLDYLDDGLLAERLEDYRVVFVPYSPCVDPSSLQRLAEFAKDGGTVVFAGPSGWQDPWLKPGANVGGDAFRKLGWSVAEFAAKATGKIQGLGPLATATPLTVVSSFGKSELPGGTVLMQDATGQPVAWEKAFGKGRVLALTAFPNAYSQNPHPDAANRELVVKLATVAGIEPQVAWSSPIPFTPDKLAGEGAPLVDVVLRQKSDRELFLFVMNLGGAGSGEVQLKLAAGAWKVTDALNGAAVTMENEGKIPLALMAWEYRVMRVAR